MRPPGPAFEQARLRPVSFSVTILAAMVDDVAEVRSVVARLRQLLSCPVIWPTEPWSPDLHELLIRRWKETCEQFQISYELSCFDVLEESDEEYAGSLGSLEWDRSNIEQWITRARDRYVSETRRFWALVVAGPKLHDKHYPDPTMTKEDIRRATRDDGISLLYPGISPSLLSEVLWEGLGDLAACARYEPSPRLTEFWRSAFSSTRLRVAFNMLNPIGCCYGEASSFLCFEIDASAVAHAYPITQQEAEGIADGLPLPGVDDLQGFDERRSDWSGASATAWGLVKYSE